MGDCNGQLGERRPEEKKVLGPFTYSNKPRSRNGEHITNFALENNLTILNTMFRKNKKNMWTWISPDGKTKNQIDFIMTNRNNYFTNFSVIKKLNFNTNHKLIRAELASNQPKKPRPRHDLFNTKLGKHQLEQITIALIDKFTDYESNTKEFGTRGRYNWIENTIKTQIQLIANTKTEPKKWLTTNTTKLLEARNHLISTKDTQTEEKI
ncbi:unnamed protein product [Parnassius apollo]|uniref:(apollo) hypothetical protein n=1 Tax=Parnassius apollo TaxID=110799 RepID=A0A8S3XZU6_PARAO|nr:unnamed protein product [Parnassius apollo]